MNLKPTTSEPKATVTTSMPVNVTSQLNSSMTMSKGGASPTKDVRSKINMPSSGQYPPVRSGSPKKTPSRGSSPARVFSPLNSLNLFISAQSKTQKDKEMLESYLQKLVEKHTADVMGIVRDHKNINDTIALNKRAGNLVDPNLLTTSILVGRGNYSQE